MRNATSFEKTNHLIKPVPFELEAKSADSAYDSRLYHKVI